MIEIYGTELELNLKYEGKDIYCGVFIGQSYKKCEPFRSHKFLVYEKEQQNRMSSLLIVFE